MAYRVELSPSTVDDIRTIVEYIARDSVESANQWRQQLFALLVRLASLPGSCSLAPENEYCEIEVRQLIFGQYRVLFTIQEDVDQVYVLTVRHGARRYAENYSETLFTDL